MLILTRRPGESISVGDDITVTVLSINGNQARIGIDAPRNIEIERDDIKHRPTTQEETTCQGK